MGLLPRSFRRRRSTILFAVVTVILLIGGAHYYFDIFSTDIGHNTLKYIRYNKYRHKEPYMTGPGEQGAAFYLEGDEAKLAESLIEKEAFNRIASDKISLERSLKDARDSR